MMNTSFLLLVGIVANLGCWIFSTATMVNGEHNRTAFVIKSVFYWFSAIINVLIGILIMES